jgi:hypothetical protein
MVAVAVAAAAVGAASVVVVVVVVSSFLLGIPRGDSLPKSLGEIVRQKKTLGVNCRLFDDLKIGNESISIYSFCWRIV